MITEENNSSGPQNSLPLTVIDGFMQPGFPLAKVFTCFFFPDGIVFAKTGSLGTDMAGTLRASLGGYTADAMIAGAIGGIADHFNSNKRIARASEIVEYQPESIVATNKRNFFLNYHQIQQLEMKGPNFSGEVRIIITAEKRYKFRINRQSKASAQYLEKVFTKFLSNKFQKK
jgi:hypothetical protein